jgi:shikimate kinase
MAPETRALLRGHRVVWLTVALHDATKRVGWGPGRPMLDLNPRSRLAELMAARRPLYEEVATATVDTSGRTPDEVAADVLALLGARAP